MGSASGPPARPFRHAIRLLLALPVIACSSESTGPSESPVRLVIAEGAEQFALPGQFAALPLSVQAVDATSGRPKTDIEVTWTLVEGTGAQLSPAKATTDEVGVAGVMARAGSALGTYRFEARADRQTGDPPVFVIHAVQAPVLTGISPNPVSGGQTLTIDGTGFVDSPEAHGVLFGAFRGTVLSATSTRITARVPDCVLDRATDVRVTLGAITSNGLPVETRAGAVTALRIDAGERTVVSGAPSLSCIAIEDAPAGSRYLVVPQNAARSAAVGMRFELNAIAGAGPVTVLAKQGAKGQTDAASSFELGLRRAEREMGAAALVPGGLDRIQAAPSVPAIGDRRDFNVLVSGGGTRRISATVRGLSTKAVIYIDSEAPPGGLTDADIAYFGTLFDDPIFATVAGTFGQPSDMDGNDRIIILFTPAVNGLTESGSSGFIAGYFYGCDLVSESRCSATNSGEIFYSMVPDPNGQFGGVRTRQTVLQTVPAVLAHEFQHMINFAAKDDRLDILWLSEGLAHAAEDLVGDVLAERGDGIQAGNFRRPNYTRAQIYLRSTEETPLLAEDSPGTLEQRGGAWLLVKYITGHFGGAGLLGRLTSSSATGATNIEQSTGQSWEDIWDGFSTALWADGASEVMGALAATSGFANFDLREVMAGLPGGFPLSPPVVQFQNFQLAGTLPAGSQDYVIFDVPSTTASVRLALTPPPGLSFELATGPQLTILRIR